MSGKKGEIIIILKVLPVFTKCTTCYHLQLLYIKYGEPKYKYIFKITPKVYRRDSLTKIDLCWIMDGHYFFTITISCLSQRKKKEHAIDCV